MTDFYIPKKTNLDLWYKEPWMLLVLGGPIIVIIAGLVTFYLAWQGSDNIVAKDYYKQGINIDKEIYRDAKASEYKIMGKLQLDSASGKFTLNLQGETPLPTAVQMAISSRSNDSAYEATQKIILSQMQPGIFEGSINFLTSSGSINPALWHVKVEATDWRLTADWINPLQNSLQLKPQNQ